MCSIKFCSHLKSKKNKCYFVFGLNKIVIVFWSFRTVSKIKECLSRKGKLCIRKDIRDIYEIEKTKQIIRKPPSVLLPRVKPLPCLMYYEGVRTL